MRRRLPIIFAIIGVLFIVSALVLVGYNEWTTLDAGEESRDILEQLREAIGKEDEEEENDFLAEYLPDSEEEIITIDGVDYIGYVTIPAIGIELPVQATWSQPNLKISPCRYTGSVATGDLIIAAHNYATHFGHISSLNTGDIIYFIEVSGHRHTYEVTQTDLIYGYDTEGMLDGTWDITLFTCTWSGTNRTTVRAVEMT